MLEFDFIDYLGKFDKFEEVLKEFTKQLEKEIIKLQKEKYFEQFKLENLILNDLIDKSIYFELVLVDDKEINELNKNFRNINKPTDVLSFNDYEFLNNQLFIGSIVISVDKAKKQAEEYGNTFEEELKFLTMHGFLHLLNFDHEVDKGEMINVQKKLKKQLKEHFKGN